HHDPLTYTKYTIAQKKKHYRALRRRFIPHLSKWGYSRQLWIKFEKISFSYLLLILTVIVFYTIHEKGNENDQFNI
ncbi:hypothetical protein, partial [Limosilactobacillus fermentum]